MREETQRRAGEGRPGELRREQGTQRDVGIERERCGIFLKYVSKRLEEELKGRKELKERRGIRKRMNLTEGGENRIEGGGKKRKEKEWRVWTRGN